LLSALTNGSYVIAKELDVYSGIGIDGVPEVKLVNERIVSDIFPAGMLHIPARFKFYVEHLKVIGLCHLDEIKYQDRLRVNDKGEDEKIGTIVTIEYSLTSFGEDFMAACQPPVLRPA
jgi:hypothetical protein